MLASYAIILTAAGSIAFGRRDLPPPVYATVLTLLALMFLLHLVWMDLQERLGARQAAWIHLPLNGALFLAANYLSFGGSQLSFLPFVIFMLSAEAVVELVWGEAVAFIAALSLGFVLMMALAGFSLEGILATMLSVSLGMIFTVLFARILNLYEAQVQRSERLLGELRAANAALEAAAVRERELAAAEERVHLAREIHDGLGHHLSVLNVQLQAAARLVERDPARAVETLAFCRQEAQAAMAEVRHSVAAMRRSPLDGRRLEEALATLVEDFDRASPLAARFDLLGEPVELAPAAAMTLYRAAQEGLTNAQKHARAGQVRVELLFAPRSVAVRVQDDGATPIASSQSPAGFGLAGLRERAEQLGGSLRAGSVADGRGYTLELEVPR
jgi:signal transduction histidine kinase